MKFKLNIHIKFIIFYLINIKSHNIKINILKIEYIVFILFIERIIND